MPFLLMIEGMESFKSISIVLMMKEAIYHDNSF
jgi:hypothetical protein